MRTFVAIEIPSEIREQIHALLDALRRAPADIRWSRPEGLHITLKFLGEVAPEKVEEVKARLQALAPAAPLSIAVRGAGFFPNERAPRVLWLGIQAGPELQELAARIEDSLLPLGYPKEDRPFAPHLTLGRARGTNNLGSLRELLRLREPLDMGSFVAQDFSLYESQMASGGSVYHKLARYPPAGTR
jgi:2'-5' RNA ligase